MQPPRASRLLAVFAAAALSSACATVAHVSNLSETPCAATFHSQLSSVLIEQGEGPEVADGLSDHTVRILTLAGFTSRFFLVAAPSGTDYTFFVQKKKERCLLRLVGRQKGFWSYTNNLTYISTRPLPNCVCQG
jgi:hypothetical protein